MDRLALATCLRDSPRREACIGAVAIACVRGDTAESSVGAVACARREEIAWRERLTLAQRFMLRSADEARRSQFAALQISWEGYVAQKCAYHASQQPPARAAGQRAGCVVREVGLRALEIERAARGPHRAVRPRNAPPQIIR